MLDELDLDKAGAIVSIKAKEFRPMSRKQMLRIADRLPQAMVKLTSYQNGMGSVVGLVKYLNRDDELLMESDDGFVFNSTEEIKETLNEWALDFHEKKRNRDTMHIVLSTPPGSDRRSTHRAIRSFAGEVFSRNHSYIFAIHNDTKNPHGHLVVKICGHDGLKIDPRKEDLYRWREIFSEKCRENGIEVDASKRLARGIGTKRGMTGTKRAVMESVKRGETVKFHEELKVSVKEGVKESNKYGKFSLKVWEKRAKSKTESYKKLYLDEAKQISKEAKNSTGKDRERLEMESEKLKKFAESLPEPESLRELSIKHVISANEKKIKDISKE